MQENHNKENVFLISKMINRYNIPVDFRRYFHKYFELVFWSGAIVLLFIFDPTQESHYSLCLFKNLGFQFCPGCGLGHSISYLLHGKLNASINTHPLGIIALPVILYRIFKLAKYNF